jgi:prophage regulatory protein
MDRDLTSRHGRPPGPLQVTRTPPDNARGQRIIRCHEVQHKVGYSQMHIWRLERKGDFPQRVKLGPNSVGWIEAEVDAWIAGRIRAAGGQPWQLKRRWAREREEKPAAASVSDKED